MDREILMLDWERHFGSVWAELQRLLGQSGSATAVLLDASGNAVTYAGEDPDFDLSSFASLAVADFLATREMAALLGEEELRWVVHQGERSGLVLAPLHPDLVLAVLFDDRTSLGLVRHQMRKDRERLQTATQPLLRLLRERMEAESADADEAGPDDEKVAEDLRRLFTSTS